jgi:hypothetical protein
VSWYASRDDIWFSDRFENVLSFSISAFLAHSDWRGGDRASVELNPVISGRRMESPLGAQ